jgi:biotin carboxylase
MASERIGLATNPPAAVRASRDKVLLRSLLTDAGVTQPRYVVVPRGDRDVAARVLEAAATLGYPCVLKPSNLAASRGVIRVDDPVSAASASARIERILGGDGDTSSPLLLEEFVEGPEIAIEGLVRDGRFEVLAFFDKPDPLDGPFFEETIYVTPSRHDASLLDAAARLVDAACRAMALVTGPVHAEVRLGGPRGPAIIEVAARTIGGRCATALSFARGATLEQIVLGQALSLDGGRTPGRLLGASGVMMLPIERSGRLAAVEGREAARAVEHITGLELSIPVGHRIEALPEGSRYLGFLFARAATPVLVEDALRAGHAKLDVRIEDVATSDAGQAA